MNNFSFKTFTPFIFGLVRTFEFHHVFTVFAEFIHIAGSNVPTTVDGHSTEPFVEYQ
jgi:hypothetical protein